MKVYEYFWKRIFLIVLITICVNGDGDKVNPKLDFEESKEVPVNKTTDRSSTPKKSPKIQGVSITVDTGNIKKSKENDSNESVEIEDGKNTRKIGIHTDITFEITDDKNSPNLTSSADDNDASVPVFKGRDTTTTKRPQKKPFDPRHQPWTPNQPPDTGRFYHHYNPSYPVFPRTRDDTNIYRSIDSWSNFVPITTVWTTERPPYYYYPSVQSQSNLAGFSNYQNNYGTSYHRASQGPQWKPCYCLSEVSNSWKNKRRSVESSVLRVNDKLENPFSSRRRK